MNRFRPREIIVFKSIVNVAANFEHILLPTVITFALALDTSVTCQILVLSGHHQLHVLVTWLP